MFTKFKEKILFFFFLINFSQTYSNFLTSLGFLHFLHYYYFTVGLSDFLDSLENKLFSQ